jgi:hypothetical protein
VRNASTPKVSKLTLSLSCRNWHQLLELRHLQQRVLSSAALAYHKVGSPITEHLKGAELYPLGERAEKDHGKIGQTSAG